MATERRTGARGGALVRAPKAEKKQVRITPTQKGNLEQGRLKNNWRTYFLQALAETSNVTQSAARAGASPSRAYKARREDARFAAQWRAALLEGYDHLELEVLGYLRNPDPKHKMDVASAVRLLTMHAATVARERALREDEDEQEVLDSIDQFIEEMRERRAANAAILIEADPDDGEE